MQQDLDYAKGLDIPFVFSSNGDAFLFHDRTGQADRIERERPLDDFPSPAELWARYRQWKNLAPADEQIVLQDYHDDGSGKEPRHVFAFSLIFFPYSCRSGHFGLPRPGQVSRALYNGRVYS